MKFLQMIFLVMTIAIVPLFADPSGIYYGGGVGQSFIETQVTDFTEGDFIKEDFKLDGNDFAYKVFAGVRMSSALGIEGGFRSLGSVKSKVSDVTFLSKTTGYDLSAVGNIYLGILDVFAKGGAFWWDEEVEGWSEKSTNGGTNFIWGFGATVRLGQMGIRAEWERFELAEYDQLAMMSLSVVFGL